MSNTTTALAGQTVQGPVVLSIGDRLDFTATGTAYLEAIASKQAADQGGAWTTFLATSGTQYATKAGALYRIRCVSGTATVVQNDGTASDLNEAMLSPQLMVPGSSAPTIASNGQLANGSYIGIGTCALIGDSRMANGFSTTQTQQQSVYPNLLGLLDGAMVPVGFFAVGGTTLAHVLSVQVPQVLALNPLPEEVWLDSGHNDIYIDNADYPTCVARHAAVVNALTSVGIRVRDFTTTPSGVMSAGGKVVCAKLNAYRMSNPYPGKSYICHDVARCLVDPTTGVLTVSLAMPAESAAPVHVAYTGGWIGATGLLAEVQNTLKPRNRRIASDNSVNVQAFVNPSGYGSNASGDGSITGSFLPTSWEAGHSGTATAVLSKQSVTGRPITLTQAVVTAGANANDNIYVGGNSDAFATAALVGTYVRGVARVNTLSMTGTGAHIYLSLAFFDSGFSLIGSTYYGNYADNTYSNGVMPTGPQTLFTPAAAIPANTAHIKSRLYVGGNTGATVTFIPDFIETQLASAIYTPPA